MSYNRYDMPNSETGTKSTDCGCGCKEPETKRDPEEKKAPVSKNPILEKANDPKEGDCPPKDKKEKCKDPCDDPEHLVKNGSPEVPPLIDWYINNYWYKSRPEHWDKKVQKYIDKGDRVYMHLAYEIVGEEPREIDVLIGEGSVGSRVCVVHSVVGRIQYNINSKKPQVSSNQALAPEELDCRYKGKKGGETTDRPEKVELTPLKIPELKPLPVEIKPFIPKPIEVKIPDFKFEPEKDKPKDKPKEKPKDKPKEKPEDHPVKITVKTQPIPTPPDPETLCLKCFNGKTQHWLVGVNNLVNWLNANPNFGIEITADGDGHWVWPFGSDANSWSDIIPHQERSYAQRFDIRAEFLLKTLKSLIPDLDLNRLRMVRGNVRGDKLRYKEFRYK